MSAKAIFRIAVLLWGMIATFPQLLEAQGFYLHDGDRVVFYGDSITEQGFYTAVVDLYTRTRFPAMHVQFFTAGIGGDRVSGGFAGAVDERLQRDVFSHKPTVVTIMLGMNDGGYQPLTDQILSTYTQGYEHILQSIRKSLPDARITILAPSPYDEITRPPMFPGGYNGALLKLASADRVLAGKYNALYVDLNAPLTAALIRGNQLNPLATEMLIPDRVHPGLALHWIMASAILKAWRAPRVVTSTHLAAGSSDVASAEGTRVTDVVREKSSLTWTQRDQALPLPLDASSEDLAFVRQVSDIEEALNQELLQVDGLPAGKYALSVDGAPVVSLSSDQLQSGVNLAEWKTPMRQQSQAAMWLIRDYEYTQLVHTRLLVRDRDKHLPSEAGDAELNKFEALEQQLIQDSVQPAQHTFRLELEPAAP